MIGETWVMFANDRVKTPRPGKSYFNEYQSLGVGCNDMVEEERDRDAVDI